MAAAKKKKSSTKKKASSSGSKKKKTATRKSTASASRSSQSDNGLLGNLEGDLIEELTEHAKDAITSKIEEKMLEGGTSGLEKIKNLFSGHKSDETAAADGGDEDVSSSANDLRQLKKLMDEGVITKEEFEAKKKQILGL